MIDRSYQANQDGSLRGKWAGFRQHDPANKLGRSDANKNSEGRCSCSWVLVVWDRPCWGHTTTAQFKCETDATAPLLGIAFAQFDFRGSFRQTRPWVLEIDAPNYLGKDQ